MIQKFDRHKTAINRSGFSFPIRKALESGIICEEFTLLDYGCGKGEDVHRLHKIGISAKGWDPIFRPDTPLDRTDIVNLGFVLNVIEEPTERVKVLKTAWSFTQKVLLISARTNLEKHDLGKKYLDGFISSRNTFQKFYTQNELFKLINRNLGTKPVAIAPGVFFAFKDESMKYKYLSQNLFSTTFSPEDIKLKYKNINEQTVPLLQELKKFFCNRGRVPRVEDIPETWHLYIQYFGSIKRALTVIKKAEPIYWFEDTIQNKKNDLLVLLAGMIFSSRPKFSDLPGLIQRDIKALFSSYKNAYSEANLLLFSAGNQNLIAAATNFSEIGKHTQQAIYIHRSALSSLPPILRVFEICARVVSGEIPEANIIKLSKSKAQVSYLNYPKFDKDPHPALHEAFTVSIAELEAKYRSYSITGNPPILHRKETLVKQDYPKRSTYARLTKQEEHHHLFDDNSLIGHLKGWNKVLKANKIVLRGHRLYIT